MPDKKNVHTVPTDDGWANRREGGKRASSTHATKAEAQAAGRTAAKKDGVEHLIHKKDGTSATGTPMATTLTRLRADRRTGWARTVRSLVFGPRWRLRFPRADASRVPVSRRRKQH